MDYDVKFRRGAGWDSRTAHFLVETAERTEERDYGLEARMMDPVSLREFALWWLSCDNSVSAGNLRDTERMYGHRMRVHEAAKGDGQLFDDDGRFREQPMVGDSGGSDKEALMDFAMSHVGLGHGELAKLLNTSGWRTVRGGLFNGAAVKRLRKDADESGLYDEIEPVAEPFHEEGEDLPW